MCVCFRVSAFLHDNSKSNQSMDMKFEYIFVYEISRTSSILGIAGPRSRSWRDFEMFLHLPQYKLSGPITLLWYKLGSWY